MSSNRVTAAILLILFVPTLVYGKEYETTFEFVGNTKNTGLSIRDQSLSTKFKWYPMEYSSGTIVDSWAGDQPIDSTKILAKIKVRSKEPLTTYSWTDSKYHDTFSLPLSSDEEKELDYTKPDFTHSFTLLLDGNVYEAANLDIYYGRRIISPGNPSPSPSSTPAPSSSSTPAPSSSTPAPSSSSTPSPTTPTPSTPAPTGDDSSDFNSLQRGLLLLVANLLLTIYLT